MKKVLGETKERLSNVISKESDVATKNAGLKAASAVKKLTFTEKEIEAILAANKKWTVKALFHIFKGECVEGKLVSGLHTKKALKHFMKKLRRYGIKPSDFKMETLPNGVTRIVLPFEAFVNRKCRGRAIARLFDGTKIERAKTLWPDHYTPQKIMEAIHSIIRNPEKIVGNMISGYTPDGVRTIIKFNEAKQVVTAFPS